MCLGYGHLDREGVFQVEFLHRKPVCCLLDSGECTIKLNHSEAPGHPYDEGVELLFVAALTAIDLNGRGEQGGLRSNFQPASSNRRHFREWVSR